MRLDRPDIDDNSLIDSVVAERQNGRNADFFNSISEEWKARSKVYIDAAGNPEIIKPWPGIEPHKKKLQNLYLSPKEGSTQKPILDDLRSRSLQLCPACGEDGTPNTLDHYLPKEIFPELSITPANLFPMCDICQGEKGTKTVNGKNERLFIHPYFDEFTDKQIVVLEIGKPFEAPVNIVIKPHPELDEADSKLVFSHLIELGIHKRYHRFFRDEHMRLLRLTNNMRDKGQDIRKNLELFREYALHKSINSWGHVFYTGVLENKDLMTYLESGKLPALR